MTIALFLIDGLRPDALQQAETPVIDKLVASGTSTFNARTVMPSVTLPCITSLFLGVPPERHGVTTNVWTPPARPVPGLVDVIQQSGRHAASFYNWEELRDISRPGSLAASFFLKNCHSPDGDTQVAKLAAEWLKQNPIDFAFIYLGHTDEAGHDFGWMSPQYFSAITNADHCIGQVINALPQDTTVMVTSDHGGHAQSHGTNSDEDMTIPCIIHGPNIPTTKMMEPFFITDIAPMATRLLGLSSPREWIGKSIAF